MSRVKLHIAVGIPASGKSTYARELFKDGWVVTERDWHRRQMSPMQDINNYKYSKAKEDQVTAEQRSRVVEALKLGRNVFVADTNLNEKTRKGFKLLASTLNAEYDEIEFDCTLDLAIKRNIKRHASVPESVIIGMEKKMRVYMDKFVQDPTNPEDLPLCVICDIDGTVADMKGVRGPFDWPKVGLDKPRTHVIHALQGILDHGESKVLKVFSGRDEVCYSETEEWFEENVKRHYTLDMRPEGSFEKDTIVKERMFNTHIKGQYHVHAVLDDRKVVCQMWESMGLPVINVGGFLADF